MIKKLLFLVLCLFLIFPIVSAEDYSSSLVINQFTSVNLPITFGGANSGSTKTLDNSGDTNKLEWQMDFNGMNEGSSIIVYQTSYLTNDIDNFISHPVTFTYNGQIVATGTASLFSNGVYNGMENQLVIQFDTFTKPVGVEGTQSVNWSTPFKNSLGQDIIINQIFAGMVLDSPLDATSWKVEGVYNYNLNVINNFDLSQTAPFTLLNVQRNNHNTKIKVYSPDNTVAYSDLLFNASDMVGNNIYTAGSVRIQMCIPQNGGMCVNSTKYYGDNFTATFTPSTINYNENGVGTIASPSNSLANINAFTWKYIDSSGQDYEFFTSNTNPYKTASFVKRSGTWYSYNSSSMDFDISSGATLPNPQNLKLLVTGNVTVKTFIYNTDNEYFDISNNIFVNPTGQANNTVTLLLQSVDATTNQHIPSPSLTITDKSTNVVITGIGDSIDGVFVYKANIGSILTIQSGATGYTANQITYSVGNGNNIVTIPLTPTSLPIPASDISKTNLQIEYKFSDSLGQYYPAPNQVISLTYYDNNETASNSVTTNSAGIAFISVINQSNNYPQFSTVVYNKMNGYKEVSKSFKPYGNLYKINLYTTSDNYVGYTTVPTPNLFIPTQTPIPLPSIQGGYGNNGTMRETSVCQQPPYPTGWTIIDGIFNGIACSGVRGAGNQNLIMAIIIMMVCGMILGKAAKGIGAIAGVIAGAGICFGMGILPIWILIFVVVVCGLVFAGLIFGLKP